MKEMKDKGIFLKAVKEEIGTTLTGAKIRLKVEF